jgi:pimeloyl-ACP methyl ester carboxylesterase
MLSMILAVVTVLLLVVAAFLLGGGALVKQMVLHGTAHGSPKAELPSSPDYEVIPLHIGDGTKIFAQFGKATDTSGAALTDYARRPALIYCYPGGGYMKWSRDQFAGFRRLGLNVIMPEYPGYGMSGGRPSEAGCYAAADAAYCWVLGRPDLGRSPVFAAGWSLGGATVVDLASRHHLEGVVLVGTPTRLSEGLRHLASQHAPLSWFPGSIIAAMGSEPKMDSLGKIARVSCPILIAYGTMDRLLSRSMVGQFKAAATGPVTELPISGAGHFNAFKAGGPALWQSMGGWIDRIAAQAGP